MIRKGDQLRDDSHVCRPRCEGLLLTVVERVPEHQILHRHPAGVEAVGVDVVGGVPIEAVGRAGGVQAQEAAAAGVVVAGPLVEQAGGGGITISDALVVEALEAVGLVELAATCRQEANTISQEPSEGDATASPGRHLTRRKGTQRLRVQERRVSVSHPGLTHQPAPLGTCDSTQTVENRVRR